MSLRRGFTLTELTIAMVIGFIAMAIAYQAMHLLLRAEESTDRKATRTLAEARLNEMLLRDLRSSTAVISKNKDEYTITRWVMEAGTMVKQDATWRVVDKVRVVRELPGESPMTFDFDGLLDPGEPAFKFRLEKPPDVTSGSPDPGVPAN